MAFAGCARHWPLARLRCWAVGAPLGEGRASLGIRKGDAPRTGRGNEQLPFLSRRATENSSQTIDMVPLSVKDDHSFSLSKHGGLV
eukprot:638873-Rhodomonas_salina.4